MKVCILVHETSTSQMFREEHGSQTFYDTEFFADNSYTNFGAMITFLTFVKSKGNQQLS